MINVESNSIRIFPSSNRASDTQQFGTNWVTEYNLSSIVYKLLLPQTTQQGFLITTTIGDITQPDGGGAVEFNIGGYFVSVDSWKTIIDAATSSSGDSSNIYQNFICFQLIDNVIYAQASISNGDGSDISYNYMSGSDNVSATTSGSQFTLQLPLLNYTSSTEYSIYSDSMLRFNNINIDDGTL